MRRVTAPTGRVVVVGAGASPLVRELARDGFDVTALDVSKTAIEVLRTDLAGVDNTIDWAVGDVCAWRPPNQFDTWHDRAVFHFLLDQAEQQAYVEAARSAVRAGGHIVIATFAPTGPDQCSGLPVARHDAASLRAAFGDGFELVEAFEADHITPWAATQRFTHAVLRRTAGASVGADLT